MRHGAGAKEYLVSSAWIAVSGPDAGNGIEAAAVIRCRTGLLPFRVRRKEEEPPLSPLGGLFRRQSIAGDGAARHFVFGRIQRQLLFVLWISGIRRPRLK